MFLTILIEEIVMFYENELVVPGLDLLHLSSMTNEEITEIR